MWLLLLINALSVFGYASFTLHPELLVQFPWSQPIYALSYPFFARLQIIVCLWICIRACHPVLSWRWLIYFALACILSFTMEFGGTTYGIPFGQYDYTSLLGWKTAGKVPVLIPVSWFCMSLCCYLLADQLVGKEPSRMFGSASSRIRHAAARITVAVLLLIAWDFTLEPAMSQLTPYWIWREPEVFFLGVAVKNLLGWVITGFLIFLGFEILKLGKYAPRFERGWSTKFYLLNLSLPVGLSVAGSAWSSVVLTGVTLSGLYIFGLSRGTLKFGFRSRNTSP